MIELYGARTGNCLRVSVALEEIGLPYSVRHIELRRGEHLGEAYRALNPAGKVPTIVDDSVPTGRLVLTQSNAILFYLADRAPGALLPMETAARALALERFFFVLTDVIGPNHAAFRLRREGVETAAMVLEAVSATMLASAEALLQASRFMAGAAFGLADIAAVTTLASVLTAEQLAALPRLSAWYSDVITRTSVEQGMRAFNRAT